MLVTLEAVGEVDLWLGSLEGYFFRLETSSSSSLQVEFSLCHDAPHKRVFTSLLRQIDNRMRAMSMRVCKAYILAMHHCLYTFCLVLSK